MNPKQAAPLLVTLAPLAAAAPPLIIGGLIGGAIFLVLKALLSDDEEKKPEAATVETSTESRKMAETAVFRQIPAEIPGKPPAVPVASVPRLVVPPPSIPRVPAMSVPVPSASNVAVQPASARPVLAVVPTVHPVAKVVQPPQSVPKKTITRADMATIFEAGRRSLSRLDAVAALKRLGFGKTAAYSATAPDGRFSEWLVFASDGIIYWAEKRQNPEIA
jgi:hypothetical protein